MEKYNLKKIKQLKKEVEKERILMQKFEKDSFFYFMSQQKINNNLEIINNFERK